MFFVALAQFALGGFETVNDLGVEIRFRIDGVEVENSFLIAADRLEKIAELNFPLIKFFAGNSQRIASQNGEFLGGELDRPDAEFIYS